MRKVAFRAQESAWLPSKCLAKISLKSGDINFRIKITYSLMGCIRPTCLLGVNIWDVSTGFVKQIFCKTCMESHCSFCYFFLSDYLGKSLCRKPMVHSQVIKSPKELVLHTNSTG